jgi:hypothetical protein
MSDQHDNPSDAPARATPQYRVRKPEGETSARKSAQNTAESASTPQAAIEPKPADAAMASGKTDEKPPETPHGKPTEIGGPKGLEPTRFGDWERDGRCVDF